MDHKGPWPSPDEVVAFVVKFCRNESIFCEEGNKKQQKNHIKFLFEKVNKSKVVDLENFVLNSVFKKILYELF